MDIPKKSDLEQSIVAVLNQHCEKYRLTQIRFLNLRKTGKIKDVAGNVIDETELEHLKELNYHIRLKRNDSMAALVTSLENLPDLRDLRVKFDNEKIKL